MIIPTDTVYGFSGIVDSSEHFNTDAIIRKIKGREEYKPFIQLIAAPEDIVKYTDDVVPKKLLDCWPGPLTIIVLGHLRLGHRSVRDVDVFRQDVHPVQQRVVDTVVPALLGVRGGRVVFVDGDDLHVAERDLPGPVAAQQLLVERGRRGAGRQTQAEQASLTAVDGRDDVVRHGGRGRNSLRIDMRPYFLVVVKNAGGEVLLDQTAFVG